MSPAASLAAERRFAQLNVPGSPTIGADIGADIPPPSPQHGAASAPAWNRLGEEPLTKAKVLDFGCGYGRLLRLFLHAVNPDQLFGCDPWDKAIDLCRDARLPCDLQITDYLPERLPYSDHSFDLAYAFSVFTHTSERATRTALSALRAAVCPGGLLVVTIRPESYWALHNPLTVEERASLEAAHATSGFAFKPHLRQAIDGDVTYGDTSMTVDTLARLGPGWRPVHDEILPEAPFQRIVYLRAVD